MKKKVAAMVLAILLLISGTAFATNWIYAKRVDESGMTFYFDTDSAVKNSDSITFWTLGVWERTRNDGVRKATIHYEITLSSPRYYRQIDGYLYDENNNEIQHDANVREWQTGTTNGSAILKLSELAFTYAR